MGPEQCLKVSFLTWPFVYKQEIAARNIWKSKRCRLKTKIRFYNGDIKAVLLYGSECRRGTKLDMRKVDIFHNSCLRKICNIFWPNKISNEEDRQLAYVPWLRWLAHVLRMANERLPKVALRWRLIGKRKRGGPKNTWWRTVMELEEMGSFLGPSTGQSTRRCMIVALCPNQEEEEISKKRKININKRRFKMRERGTNTQIERRSCS